MEDYRYIIKTNDGRYVKGGDTQPTFHKNRGFCNSIFNAKFFKSEDDAKRVANGGYRWLEKHGKSCDSNWPSEFVVVKVSIKEQ